MHKGNVVRKGLLLCLFAATIHGVSPPSAWSAPPAHANKDKNSDDTTKPGKGRQTPPANSAPTISGTPPSSVLQDDPYRFVPTASDPDGDSLTFGIRGLPRWATFDPLTGQVAGTPTAADVGTYTNIVINVTDGALSAELAAFSVEVLAYAQGSATLMWMPPTQNVDGSPLLDLAGYRIYWGTQSGSYARFVEVTNPGITTYVVENLAAGTYYFAATALNNQGVESDFSGEAVATVAP